MLNFSSSLIVVLFEWFFYLMLLFLFLSCIPIIYGDSISSKKLNGHQAFESLSLLGVLIFILKQHIS